jgi:hypothetical protein
VPLDQSVRLNNLFARGLLKFATDAKTGERTLTAQTKAVYLSNVYVNDGLAGNWKRGSGPEYDQLSRRSDNAADLQDHMSGPLRRWSAEKASRGFAERSAT